MSGVRVKLAVAVLMLACGCSEPSADARRAGAASDAPVDEAWFEVVDASSGLDFLHVSAPTRKYLFPEIMSGGVALFDADGDGDLDVYLVQGGDLERPDASPPNQLFENRGDWSFVDVTERAGVGDRGYGMGAACGDVDGDGDIDLYVTNLGRDVFFENQGNGVFVDATDAAGLVNDSWGTSATFFDLENDGDLDLFVANYVDWRLAKEKTCYLGPRNDQRDYCPPRTYEAPTVDVLFENLGDGTFENATERLGLGAASGYGLGVVAADLDRDGLADLYVANDGMPNRLWIQNAGGGFEDHALIAGCALGGAGQAQAGMGLVALDLEADGDLDLVLSHLRGEPNTIYLQENGFFRDRTAALGLGGASRAFTGFGLGVADFDNDARLDVFVANGHVLVEDPVYEPRRPYAQPNQLFRGLEGGRFEEVRPRGGLASEVVESSRAAAFGDLDGDGDVDVVVVDQGAPVHVLRNVAGERGAWIGFRVVDAGGRQALGAVVELVAGRRAQSRLVQSGYSIQASNDPRVLFGLGELERVEVVEVTWPAGRKQSFGPFEAGRYHELRELRAK